MGSGKQRATRLQDVADAAGVHVSTASRALSERTAALVSHQTLIRVHEAADDLGYRMNGLARALKTKRSHSIGMIIPDIRNPFFPPAVWGAEGVLGRQGFSLLLSSSDNDPGKARRQVSAMLEGRVDGLLLAMTRRDDVLVDELRAGEVPVVLMNRTVDRGGVSAVVPDDNNGTLLAVEHLYGLGHRRMGFVGGPLFTSNGERRRASFEQTVARLGLPDRAIVEAAAFDIAAGARGAAELFDQHPATTAVVAGNDLIAIGVIEEAERRGRSCPADVSVVGFNDMLLADRLRPPLTTVRVLEDEVGARAAELLLATVEDPGRHTETVLISGELVVRGSTAAPG